MCGAQSEHQQVQAVLLKELLLVVLWYVGSMGEMFHDMHEGKVTKK